MTQRQPPSEPMFRGWTWPQAARLVTLVTSIAVALMVLFRLFGWAPDLSWSPPVEALLRPIFTATDEVSGLFDPDPPPPAPPVARAPRPLPPPPSPVPAVEIPVATPPASPPAPPRSRSTPARTPPASGSATRRSATEREGQMRLPAAAEDESEPTEAPPPVAQIQQLMETGLSTAVRGDIALHKAIDPGLSGEIGLRVTVVPSGKVQRVQITRNTTHNKQLSQRIAVRIYQLKFPPFPGDEPVILPLTYSITE